MISKILVALLLGPILLYNITESCGRVPEIPKPTTLPITTTQQATLNDSVRSLPCTENETTSTGCLNGGSCFVLVLENNVRETSCHCTEEYRGLTCEELNIDILVPSTDGDGVATAGIAATLAVVIVIVVVIIVVAILYSRNKRKAKREREEQRKREEAALKFPLENGKLPENPIQPRPRSNIYQPNGTRNSFPLLLNGNTSNRNSSYDQEKAAIENGDTDLDMTDIYKDFPYADEENEKEPMQPRPASIIQQHNGDRNSFILNGNTSSNGNSVLHDQGTVKMDGGINTDHDCKKDVPDSSSEGYNMEEVNESTPMYANSDIIRKYQLKTTSV